MPTKADRTNGASQGGLPTPEQSRQRKQAYYTAVEDDKVGQSSNIPTTNLEAQAATWRSLAGDLGALTTQPGLDQEVLPGLSTYAVQTADQATPVYLHRPVLFVGVGGSGCRVANELKALLLDMHGQMPANLLICCFDSADDPISARAHRGDEIIKLEKDSEFYLFDKVPVAGIKRQPQLHPLYIERLGKNLDNLKRAFIKDGAEQLRPAGLLALLWNASLVEQVLFNAIHRLTKQNQEVGVDLEHDHSIQVFVVGSSAGGQGSGAALDVAQILREKLFAQGNLGESSSLVGMFLQPSAFYADENIQMQANAMAFAKELNELMVGGRRFVAHYPSGTTIESSEQPFDHVMVFEGINEYGQSWPNHDAVCGHMAQTLAILTGSAVGMHEIGALVNKRGVLLNITDSGFGTYLATAGLAMIHFPRRVLAKRCALRQSAAVCDYWLASWARAAEHDPASNTFDLDLADLRNQLTRTKEGGALQVHIARPAGLNQFPAEEMPAQARLLVDNYVQRRLFAELFARVAENESRRTEMTRREITTQINALLTSGDVGQAKIWLRNAQENVQRHLARASNELSRSAQQVEHHRMAFDSASEAMDRVGEGPLRWLSMLWQNQMRTAVQTVLEEAGRLAEARLAHRTVEAMQSSLLAVAQCIDENLQRVAAIELRLREAHTILVTMERTMAQQLPTPGEIVLADQPLLERLYDSHAHEAPVAAQMILTQQGGMAAWATQRAETVAMHLLNNALTPFQPLLHMNVEAILAQYYAEHSPQHWIARLAQLAGGAWNPDRALLRHGNGELAAFLTVGVPDESQSLFADSGHTLVSLHDPERIVVLRTLYGCSFDALKAFGLWQRAYNRMSGHHPLHILPDFQQDDERVLQLFGLGLIYGYIEKQAAWYYYRPEDELQAPVRLAHGLENAITSLSQHPAQQGELTQRIHAQVTAIGFDQAASQIESWLARYSKQQDEPSRRLCVAVRNYMASLQNKRQLGAL